MKLSSLVSKFSACPPTPLPCPRRAWRDLPPALGHWHNVFTRFSRWSKAGVWQRVIEAVSEDVDLEALLIDSTVVRAHQHAAGAQKKRGRKRSGARAGG